MLWRPHRWWTADLEWWWEMDTETLLPSSFPQTVLFKWTVTLFICTVILRELQNFYFYASFPFLTCVLQCSKWHRWNPGWDDLNSLATRGTGVSEVVSFQKTLIHPPAATLCLPCWRTPKKWARMASSLSPLPCCMLTSSQPWLCAGNVTLLVLGTEGRSCLCEV